MPLTPSQFADEFSTLITGLIDETLSAADFETAMIGLWSDATTGGTSIAQIGAEFSQVLGMWNANQQQFADWLAGTADFDSPNPDQPALGWYPMTNFLGTVIWVPSLAKIILDTADKGWAPELAVVNDGERRVLRVVDWVGGEGTKPTSGLYVGATGLEVDIANGVDVRGPIGEAGADSEVPGPRGDPGLDGEGLEPGGTEGQIIIKEDGTDYNVKYVHPRPNLLPYGGFEQGMFGWGGFAANWTSVDHTSFGRYARTTVAGSKSFRSKRFPVVAGTNYILHGKFLLGADSGLGGSVGARLIWYDAAGAVLSNSAYTAINVSTAGVFVHAVTVDAAAPASAAFAAVQVLTDSLAGTNRVAGAQHLKVEAGARPCTPYSVEGTLQQGIQGRVKEITAAMSPYTLLPEDDNVALHYTGATAGVINLPGDLFPGFNCSAAQIGVGQLSWAHTGGGAAYNPDTHTKVRARYCEVGFRVFDNANEASTVAQWLVNGDTKL